MYRDYKSTQQDLIRTYSGSNSNDLYTNFPQQERNRERKKKKR